MSVLQVTTKIGCEPACSYCPQNKIINAYKKRNGNISLSLEDFQEILEKIPSNIDIWFAGMSEPWLNPECTRMILYADQKGHKISVFTTLVGLKSPEIDLINSIPFGFFQIHLPSENGLENITISDEYLSVLDKISKSSINPSYHCHSKKIHPDVKLILDRKKKYVDYRSLYKRSGNITIKDRMKLHRKYGVIACKRELHNNVLLPNGDVLLCSNDYGMKHVLGNLKSSEYESLFVGKEFSKIIKGHHDESIDILCRYCQNFGYDVNLTAKIKNLQYRLDRYFYYLGNIQNLKDLKIMKDKGLTYLKNILKFN